MRWPQDSAVMRRDDHLARTRRITAWIIGAAAVASLALATAFGFALPGHALTVPSLPGTGQNGGTSGGGSGSGGSGGGSVSPPQQPPAGTVAPPVVSSGGS